MIEHHVIETIEELEELDRYISDYDGPIAYDTETNGLDWTAVDIGLCISIDPDVGFYIPTRLCDFKTRVLSQTPIRSHLTPYLQKWLVKGKRHLIMHNYSFDCRITENNFGIKLINEVLADTRLMFKMTVSEDDLSGLKELGIRYLGDDAKDEQSDLRDSVLKNGGKWLKDEKEFFMGDMPILAKYGAKDPCMTLALYEIFNPILEGDALLKKLWNEETLPLMEVVYKMNTTPFPVDLPFFGQLRTEMQGDIQNLETEVLKEIAPLIINYEKILILKKTKIARHSTAKDLAKNLGFDMKNLNPDQEFFLKEAAYRHDKGDKSPFKLTSPNDLRWLIYEKLKEPVTRKTETGKPSTDVDVIEELSKKYTWAKTLMEKRQLEKLLNTYVEGVFKHNINGVVYFDFDQGGTISGRFSTKGGIPIMTLPKGDKRIKLGFIAPKGYKLLAKDFSSLEPHLAAYLSGDPTLIDSFVSGKDFYSVIGIKQFDKKDATPYKDGTPNSFAVKYEKLRELVKTYALATLYGAEDYRISEVLHPEACSWNLRKVYENEAHDLIEGYFGSFPGTRKLIEQSHQDAHLKGEIRTKFGRIRHMPMVAEVYKKHGFKLKDHKYAKANGLMSLRSVYKNFLNNSVNIQVQGLASHACNRSAINIMREFRKAGLDAWISAQVHDELIVTVREDQVEQASKIMEREMANCIDIKPMILKTEGKVGNNLAECK
jgi:DNA polymerase I-like protein with 3'-5' exonuclease and polymerase domains